MFWGGAKVFLFFFFFGGTFEKRETEDVTETKTTLFSLAFM